MSVASAVRRDRNTSRLLVRLRPWSLQIGCAVLAIVGAGESLRLILGGATPEARWGGWYLLVVSALVAVGVLARPEGATAAPPAAAAALDPGAPEPASDEHPERMNHGRAAVIFFIAAFIFAWALPWVGFAVANGLFVAAYLVWVDRRRWYVAIGIAVLVDAGLVGGLHFLDVFLPTGVLGLGF